MRNLNCHLIQCKLAWEAPADNRRQFEDIISTLSGQIDLIILPEMFNTGFSMSALANAEEPGGATELWLGQLARRYNCALSGSIAVRVGDAVYNRMLFATPQSCHSYDKRHLFRMAGEHHRYAPGSQRVIVNWRGWRILLQICYDLRFPVFSRNQQDYDLALYVANWPAPRRLHWRNLLQARAIENLACVIGVNRIGSDAKGNNYAGDSLVIAGNGEILVDMKNENGTASALLNGTILLNYRESFPCQLDADAFQLASVVTDAW